MNKKTISKLITGISLIIAFVLWTILVVCVDVKPIGPFKSGIEGQYSVGMATMNEFFLGYFEYNEALLKITDALMYSVILAAAIFGLIGIIQWIKRKSILKVDHQILVLGCSYIVVILAYVFFEIVKVNYRPVLIDGKAEASYPSSHTMTALFVFLSAIPMVSYLLKEKKILKIVIIVGLILLAAFTVIGRILSGAHWMSDIVGGCLFATGVLFLFLFFIEFFDKNKCKNIEVKEKEM